MSLTTNDVINTLIAMGYDSASVAGTLRKAGLSNTSAEALMGAYLTTVLGVPTTVARSKTDNAVAGGPGAWQLVITTTVVTVTIQVPPVLQFMADFDQKLYPQLILA